MMTQGVMTQAANLFGNATGSVTLKGKQTGSGFDRIIDSSLKAGQTVSNNADRATTRKTSLPDKNSDDGKKSDVTNVSAEQNVKQRDAAKTEATNATSNKSDQSTKTVDSTMKEEGKISESEEPTVEEEVMAQVASMLQSIQDVVMGVLNLSSSELDQLLTDQGMTAVDLLQPENLQQLTLANNGTTDILSALTDENLAASIKQLLQSVEDIKGEAGLQLTGEEIKAILEKAADQTELPDIVTGTERKTGEDVTIGSENVNHQEVLKEAKGTEATGKSIETNTENQEEGSLEVTKLTDMKESSTQSDTSKKENQDLKEEDQFQTFIDNLVKVSQDTKVAFSGNLVQVSEIRDIANQIIERIKVSIQPDQTSMEMQLNPENLGKVNLTIQSKNGVMTAQFIVQNEISKEAIESQLHTLRETLTQQGIKVEAIEVTVSTYAFEQNSSESSDHQASEQNNRSSKQISLEDAFSMTELSEEETTEDLTGVRGSQIDYTA